VITFDFETFGIEGNPIYNPPTPVGVSIKFDDRPSRYYSWGHPTANNCTREQGYDALHTALKRDKEWLAHNAPFESAILRKYWKITKGNPLNFHDTQYLIFLHDPYAYSFSLKPSAERILDWPPEEQDELRRWILHNVPEAKESDWGAYICRAPGDLVGRYACGDTDRTYALFQHLHPQIVERGMEQAYQREQELAPILSASSVRGVRVDMETLHADIAKYSAAQKVSDEYIFSQLGEFDLAKDAELAAALDRADQITEWVLTPTGRRSVARRNLVGRVRDPLLLEHLAYRGVLETCLGTFAKPWLAQAQRERGRVHPQWNQVRGDKGQDGDISGTRTGRMSCKQPNLQNPPNDFEDLIIPEGQPPMMHMRQYLLPEEGHIWLKRDFSAQEMRIMAHFAEGKLYEAFHQDPSTDPHEAVRLIILEHTGINLSRKYTKITGFGIMYGRGIPNLSAALGVDVIQGAATRNAYYAALPEIRTLSDQCRACGTRGVPIVTWGGREYYREPNPDRNLSYKLLNYLIQGSAADQTKQSMIDWDHTRGKNDLLIAAVHDEINISALEEDRVEAMDLLKQAMDAPRFDVPFRSEGYIGPNWADLEDYNDPI
jgi:DNA polymerase-1